MEVIGAGLGRTGTFSLLNALNELGYKTHHMAEVFKNGSAYKWQKVVAEGDIEVKHLSEFKH